MGRKKLTTNTVDCLWVYLMPLLGGYMADAHWGRYKTVMIACGFAICGNSLLVVASLPGIITKSQRSLTALLIGLVIMVFYPSFVLIPALHTEFFVQGMGTGGFKACIGYLHSPPSRPSRPVISLIKLHRTMMAEQTTSTHPRIKVLKSGERVIIDNEQTVSVSFSFVKK
jgi:POT family proton-dependent oligopeptide transporter